MTEHLAIAAFERSAHQLAMVFEIDGRRFNTTYRYEDVDFEALERRCGHALLERIYFHIAAFEVNKLASLAPRSLDLGPFAHLHTEAFERLWRTVFRKVWAQWRYENNRPSYMGPTFTSNPVAAGAEPGTVEGGPVELLAFCGGGKDSLVAAKLLERAGVPFASLAYSSSIYGDAQPQHALIDALLDHCAPARRHHQWIDDDFAAAPLLRQYPNVRSITAAETPASIFGALPLVLAHGYREFVLAHEASANVGNLVWHETGEDINHQWGKSLEAEQLLNDYLRSELLADAHYFSVLQPVHDPVIFALLGRDLDALPATHSCNVQKPWCKRCPKCAYVWLGYMAYLPRDRVDAMFGENLLDVPANLPHYRAMLGLAEHTPFECIGQIDETRLAFELCRRKGLRGAAMDAFVNEVPPLDVHKIVDNYLAVQRAPPPCPPGAGGRVWEGGGMPSLVRDGILPQMESAAAGARSTILGDEL